MSTINAQIKLRRDTAANWTSNNPTLGAGEIAISSDVLHSGTDQPKFKIGDGTQTWTQLDYYPVASGGGVSDGTYGDIEVSGSGATWTLIATINKAITGVWSFVSAKLRLYNAGSTFYGEFQNTFTANRTITVPDKTFTIAGTDDISALSTVYQPLDSDLTSWAGVTRASGFDTFAATPNSANLAALVTDETGGGSLVFGTTPTLGLPSIVDTIDTTKKLKFILSGATTGKNLTLSSSHTDNRTMTVPDRTFTIAGTDDKLSAFAATTSAELAGVISDETGTGSLVFSNAPTLTNPIVGTQSANDNSTKAASTAYVDGAHNKLNTYNYTPYTLASSTSELVTHSIQVAAGSVAVNDILEVYSACATNNSAGTKTFRMYIHSSAGTPGSAPPAGVLVATSAAITTSTANSLSRVFPVLSTTSVRAHGGATGTFGSQYGQSAVATATVSGLTDLTSTFHIIITAQKSTAGDTATTDFTYVKIYKA